MNYNGLNGTTITIDRSNFNTFTQVEDFRTIFETATVGREVDVEIINDITGDTSNIRLTKNQIHIFIEDEWVWIKIGDYLTKVIPTLGFTPFCNKIDNYELSSDPIKRLVAEEMKKCIREIWNE